MDTLQGPGPQIRQEEPVLHAYPGGAEFGDFLHRQLEWLAEQGFQLDHESPQGEVVRRELVRRCLREGKGPHAESTLEFLDQVCAAPIPVGGGFASLSTLRHPVPEMEFWMPADGLVPHELDALCRAAVLPGRERPPLGGPTVRGMLKGIIDLVFEHEGRYWVLDYKSNRLGKGDDHYTGEAMEKAMAEHRYDVQAVVYLLALHRQLRARLGANYQPRQHLGGAVYFFMRGLHGPAGGCMVLSPPWRVIESLDGLLPAEEVRQ
jgi:exodeoxyribonuclease V beta subunit